MHLTIKTHISALFFLFFYTTSCAAQSKERTYTSVYDLHFTMQPDSIVVYPWRENAAFSNHSIPVYLQDSNRKLFAKKFTKDFPFSNQLKTEYEQRILLPNNKIEQAVVEFESKGQNIELVSIILDAIGEEENVLFSDTLKFIPDTVLNLATKSIKLRNAELLNIRICAKGKIGKDAYIAFSKLKVLIEGKSIDTFPIRILPSLVENNIPSYTAIDTDGKIELEGISEINNKKIIALGESIHGNSDVKHLAHQLILQSVERSNCKLILLEMPMEKSLAYNRFIHDKNYVLDTTLVIDDVTRDFLNRLQILNANRTEESKVNLYGMDYNSIHSSTQSSAIDIFDFATELNKEKRIQEVDQFSLLLMKEDSSHAINFLDAHRNGISKLLTIEEIECILHILKVSKEMGNDGIERFINRDSVMFLNAKFLIDKFAKSEGLKTIILGHAVHINPVSTFPAVPCTPFGEYMHKEYANYSPLLFLIGNGKSIAYDERFNRKNKLLSKSPKNSIEYSLNNIEDNAIYISLTPDFNKLTLSRFKGSHHIGQEFYPFNLYQRYKGVFFIKKSEFDSSNKKEISFDKASDVFMIKIKQRQKTLEEIKRRVQN
ncbi:erythromycin esterase family protein [Bacteroides pyogenes]|uniref:erythromycin esterase family protein n=1 Tax=Bacteroides pyogenes TaxID=310300 RepID=UPI0037353FCF